MPQKNVVKNYITGHIYHVFNHSVAENDNLFTVKNSLKYLELIGRYLAEERIKNSVGAYYQNFCDDVEILAFCLMSNHYHLLIYQKKEDGISSLMRSLNTSFSMYYNLQNKRRGAVFETQHKAVLIENDSQAQYITKYIHRNPTESQGGYKNYEFSSYKDYKYGSRYPWLKPGRILNMFESLEQYLRFVDED